MTKSLMVVLDSLQHQQLQPVKEGVLSFSRKTHQGKFLQSKIADEVSAIENVIMILLFRQRWRQVQLKIRSLMVFLY